MKVITVGRNPDNDIVVNDAKVSRTHLQIVQGDDGVCSVVDLGSANGTYVNGRRITGEVRLHPNDAIRIGDTMLSWQAYIRPFPDKEQTSSSNIAKTNRTWLWIVICAVVAVLAGGIGFYVYHRNQKQNQEILRNTYKSNEEQLRQELTQLEAERLQDKTDDELFRQALREDRDKNRKLAATKQKEAEDAKNQANIANKRSEEVEAEANQKIKAANQEKEVFKQEAEAVKQKSDSIVTAAQNAVDAAIRAEQTAELTTKFYAEEYGKMNKAFAKQVCEQLKKEVPKDNDAKEHLSDLFNKADNKGKQAIIDAIQVIKQQGSKIKGNEPEVKPDSLKTSKDSKITDDKSAAESDE